MKAWMVYHKDFNIYGYLQSLLVFADLRNRAIRLGQLSGTWQWDEYIDIRAKRAPIWDEYATTERVIDYNGDLPAGAEPFYCDDEDV